MNRDFLRNLGIAEEAVEAIMTEHGKTVEAKKAEVEMLKQQNTAYVTQVEGLTAQIAQRDSDIEVLKAAANDNAELKKQFDELQVKYTADTADLQAKIETQATEYRTTRAMEKFFNNPELKFSSALARDAAIAKFKEKGFTIDGETFLGANEWLAQLRKDSPDAFKADEPEKPKPTWGDPTPAPVQQPKKFSLAQMMQAKNDNPSMEVKFDKK